MNHRLDVSNRSLIRENRHLREALDESNGRLKVLEDNSTIPDLEASNQELVNVIDHMVDKEEMLYKENNHIKHYLSIHDKLSDKDIGRITKTGNVKDRNRSF